MNCVGLVHHLRVFLAVDGGDTIEYTSFKVDNLVKSVDIFFWIAVRKTKTASY